MYFQIYKPEKSHHLRVLDRIWKRFWIPNGKWLWFQVVPILGRDAIFEYMVVDWNQKLSRIYYRFFLHQNMDLFSLVQSLLEVLQKMWKIVQGVRDGWGALQNIIIERLSIFWHFPWWHTSWYFGTFIFLRKFLDFETMIFHVKF